MFQYKGKIIGKATVRLEWGRTWGGEAVYYLEDILVFEDSITKSDILKIWKDFKKFNSVAQNVPEKYMDAINKLCEEKKNHIFPYWKAMNRLLLIKQKEIGLSFIQLDMRGLQNIGKLQ